MMGLPLNPAGYEQPVVGGTAKALTIPAGQRPRHVLIGVSGGAVRWLVRDTDKLSASFGNYVGAGGTIDWTNGEINYAVLIEQIRFIKVGQNDATLEVNYFW